MQATGTDRITKQVLLPAHRARVWRALTDAAEFGTWFGVDLAGGFAPGRTTQGAVTHEGYRHLTVAVTVDEMVPERIFSWHWHPHAVDPARDYASEAPTLVTFLLQDSGAGTLVTLVESGFEKLPPERRAQALEMNEKGWVWQMNAIAQHLQQHP